jgi:hypothetical protein
LASHSRGRVKKAIFLGGHGGVRTNSPSRRTEIGVGVRLVGQMVGQMSLTISFQQRMETLKTRSEVATRPLQIALHFLLS